MFEKAIKMYSLKVQIPPQLLLQLFDLFEALTSHGEICQKMLFTSVVAGLGGSHSCIVVTELLLVNQVITCGNN